MRSLKQITPVAEAPSPPRSTGSATHARHPPQVAYSITKFLALDAYTTTTPAWRVAAVLLAAPIPGLIGAVLPALVPLQNPLAPKGVRANPGYLECGFTITIISAIGTLLHWRAGGEIPHHRYTGRQLLGVALVSSLVQYSFGVLLVFFWRFPAPMSWIVVSTVNSTSYTLAYLAIFRGRCKHDAELMAGIKRYVPALTIQSLQIVLYPAFSVLFDKVSSVYQVLLTLAFPFVKLFMKKTLRKHTHELKDFSSEVAVTGIEICASLYQSMILQNAPSQVALVIIMTIDVLQGLFVVKVFMDRPAHVPHNQIVGEALKLLKASNSPMTSSWETETQLAVSTTSVVPSPSLITTADEKDAAHQRPDKTTDPNGARSQPARRASTVRLSPVVGEALHLVSVAESILLVEYLEVAIPLVNAIFIAVACQFNGAQYNTRLRRLYFRPHALASAIQSILFYSFLQLLSFVAMHAVMRYRYGLSATHHLAFVLEHHWDSIVGKMIGWLPIILHFTVVHFGVDFSFRFDFAAMLRDENAP